MYRIIFFVIAILIEIFLPDSRHRRYSRLFGRRRYNYMFNFFEDETEGYPVASENSSWTAGIRASSRRKKSLKACKAFLTKERYVYTLKNKNIIFVFDTNNETMSLVDVIRKGRAATVVWSEQPDSMLETKDNIFQQTFDNICVSFTERANYAGVIKVLKQNFSIVHESEKTAKPQEYDVKKELHRGTKFEQPSVDAININTASEEELATLPGITIIIAKKIIKYRDLHDGFKTKKEFFTEMKIKPHFQTQLEDLIVVSKPQPKEIKENDERIVDF